MRASDLLAVGLTVAGLGGCGGKKDQPAAGSGAGSTTLAVPTTSPGGAALEFCVKSLERAARIAPLDRAGIIVRACALCSDGFDPLIAADRAEEAGGNDPAAVWAIVEACGGVCSSTAAASFRQELAELGRDHPTIRPWRTLALACPATMHADRDAARFASGAWYALATAGARLAAARPTMDAALRDRLDTALTDLVLPLPPRSVTGNPLQLPTGAQQRPTPWLAVSLVGNQLHLGRLPFARVAADGLHLVGAPIYPGGAVEAAGLASAVDAVLATGAGFTVPDPPGRLDRPVVLAPHGSPAARVLDVVRTVGDAPSYLAVTSPAPASMWPGQLAAHPVPMAARDPVRAPHLRVALATGRVAAVDAAGHVLASAALPLPDQPMPARLYVAAAAMAPGGVVEVIAETATVADLAALLDAALRGGASGLIPAPAGATATARPRAFDGPALRALVAPP